MERAKNNKIYVSSYIPPSNQNILENQFLSVVNYPDSLGQSCNYEAFSVPLGDSCRTQLGLPNMPNYNLGATSIYQADAGVDTFLCQSDTTLKGVPIGTDPITGVQYNWQNAEISAADKQRSKLLVTPSQSTWYYLELTDTSIVGSCQSLIDSVLVEVIPCPGIAGTPNLYDITLYPNPSHGQVHIAASTINAPVQFQLFTLLGKAVVQQPLKGHTTLDISALPPGVYLYQLQSEGHTRFGKLVVE